VSASRPKRPSLRKRRSLEDAVRVLCRLHRRMQRLGYSQLELAKRKKTKLRECVQGLAHQIDTEYYYLCQMLHKKQADPGRVQTALRALALTIQEDVGLLKNQRRYLLKALRLSAEVKSLDQAFGLSRRQRGRPERSTRDQIAIAADMLRRLLKGELLESAAYPVGEKWGIKPTQARAYWAKNKIDAIALVRSERPLTQYPWKSTEVARLRRLLAKQNRIASEFFRQENGSHFPSFPTAPEKDR
jgi:hypothetical protein